MCGFAALRRTLSFWFSAKKRCVCNVISLFDSHAHNQPDRPLRSSLFAPCVIYLLLSLLLSTIEVFVCVCVFFFPHTIFSLSVCLSVCLVCIGHMGESKKRDTQLGQVCFSLLLLFLLLHTKRWSVHVVQRLVGGHYGKRTLSLSLSHTHSLTLEYMCNLVFPL